jgi:DNA polymerase III epsilon subunit-like protein
MEEYNELMITPKHKIEPWAELVSEKIYNGEQVVVFFDTETTGGVSGNIVSVLEKNDLKYEGKLHRILEIGAIVTILNEKTGGYDVLLDKDGDRVMFHEYTNIWAEEQKELRRINSMTEVPFGAYRVHGISEKFLAGHVTLGHSLRDLESDYKVPRMAPTMKQIIKPLMKVMGLTHIVKNSALEKTVQACAHNIEFDNKFMNSEFSLAGQPLFESLTSPLCTLKLARSVLPKEEVNKKYSLDNLYQYVKEKKLISTNQSRDLHGALVDTEIALQMMNGIVASEFYKKSPNAPIRSKQEASEKNLSNEITSYLNIKTEKLKTRRPLPLMKM